MARHTDFNAPPPDGSFDAVAALAARRCGAGLALVRLLDEGGAAESVASLSAFNTSGIALSPQELVRIATPEAAMAAGMGFFVGVPVRSGLGATLGVLAVVDRASRAIDEGALADLKMLARIVADSIELRIEARRQIVPPHAELIFPSRG